MEVLSPVGVRTNRPKLLAARLSSLQGRVIGLMDNHKPAGRQLLEGLREELSSYGVKEFVYRQKPHPAGPSPHVEEIASRCDAVVGAIGD